MIHLAVSSKRMKEIWEKHYELALKEHGKKPNERQVLWAKIAADEACERERKEISENVLTHPTAFT